MTKGEDSGIWSTYLKPATDLFGKTDYRDKEGEVLERLDIVEKEEKVFVQKPND